MNIGPSFNSGFGVNPIIPGFTPGISPLSPISPVPSVAPTVFQFRAGPSASSEFSPASPAVGPSMMPSSGASFVPAPTFNIALRPSAAPATEYVPVVPDVPKVTLTAEPKVGTGGAFKVPLDMAVHTLGQLSKSIQAIVTHPSGMEEKINIPNSVALNPMGPNWVDQLAKNISNAVTTAVAPAVIPVTPAVPDIAVATALPYSAPIVLGTGLSTTEKVMIGAGVVGVAYLLFRKKGRSRVSR